MSLTWDEQYREMAINCFRYCGIKTLDEFDRITIPEYRIMMEAAALREVDKDYRNHLQAFLNFAVKATKKVGKNKTKPVYSRFEKFFNYERAVNHVRKTKKADRFAKLKARLRMEGEKNSGGKL